MNMRLTQTEIIQILRKRAGLNQAELGARAFNTSFDSGRTKIKNIELGKQRVNKKDLKRIAECLNVPLEQLHPMSEVKKMTSKGTEDGFMISQKVIDMFPDLREYLEMLDKASIINDLDIIAHLSQKIANIWHRGPILVEKPPQRTNSTSKKGTDRA
jgi:transcriptional regulator with XRE-family HTH domain